MFDSVVNMIDRVLDLLGKGSQAKKRLLEIQKLEHELKEANSLIKKPDAKEIQKYDPKLQELQRIAEELHRHCYFYITRTDESETDDVMQEVFIKLCTDLKRANRAYNFEQYRENVLRKRHNKQKLATTLTKSQVQRTPRKRNPRRRI